MFVVKFTCVFVCVCVCRYSLNLRQEDMRQEVWDYLPALADWARDYLHTSPQAGQKQIILKL